MLYIVCFVLSCKLSKQGGEFLFQITIGAETSESSPVTKKHMLVIVLTSYYLWNPLLSGQALFLVNALKRTPFSSKFHKSFNMYQDVSQNQYAVLKFGSQPSKATNVAEVSLSSLCLISFVSSWSIGSSG